MVQGLGARVWLEFRDLALRIWAYGLGLGFGRRGTVRVRFRL